MKELKVFTMMLSENAEVVSGRVISDLTTVKTYQQEEGPSYKEIEIEAESLESIIKAEDGFLYKADNYAVRRKETGEWENIITEWEQVEWTKDKDWRA